MSAVPQSSFGAPTQLSSEVVSEIEDTALQLIVDGFAHCKETGFNRVGDLERHFSIRLVDCMRRIVRDRNMSFWPEYEYPVLTDDILSGESDPVHANRIDIAIVYRRLSERYFSIECKLLRLNYLTERYVSEGICRFVKGSYSYDIPIGAMIGYVLQGSPDELVSTINHHIEKILGSDHKLRTTTRLGCHRYAYASEHVRSSLHPPIRLTHLLFDMRDI